MADDLYTILQSTALTGQLASRENYHALLRGDNVQLLRLLDTAFQVREQYFGREVTIHIINNAQNGLCSEDCSYCAQSKTSTAPIAKYTTKSDKEIIDEAKRAYEAGAHRYCMVYAGRGMNMARINHLCALIRTIKKTYPLEVCVSAGILDEDAAKLLQGAGLDRLNHNLNTAPSRYHQICTTHTFADRLHTLQAARRVGLAVCSGIIAGMGESHDELIELALILRENKARSIPINFLLPIPGNAMSPPDNLSPQYCLRILCLFRFTNPEAEIRIAAGREHHLRSMEVLSLYPANSLFMDGYLNTKGGSRTKTLTMIRDAGFSIRSDKSVEELLIRENKQEQTGQTNDKEDFLKSAAELRPRVSERPIVKP